jgi:hypothetical protein
MSATMARQGGRVQLEQSDMRLALNMAKMGNGCFSRAAIEETQYLIKIPRAEVQEEKKRGVEFPGHDKVKTAMERHPAIIHQNHTARCLPCQNGTTKNLETRWRHKRTGEPLPNRRRQTPKPTPALSGTPPATTGTTSGAQHHEIINLPAGYAYSHTSLPCIQPFTLDASAQDSQDDTDFDPKMLTDEGTATG